MKPYHALVGILLGVMKKIDRLQEEITGKFTSPISGEQRLLSQLLINYDPSVRPIINASEAIQVKIGLTLINIMEVDEKNQILVTSVWLDQEWHDEMLQWEPDAFGGISSFRVPCARLWTPDIVFADDFSRGFYQSRAMVHSNGHVFWPTPAQLRSTCKIDVTFFPFDSQHCYIKLGSWTYTGYEVNVTNRSVNADLSAYIKNGEFELVSVYQLRRSIVYSCCPEPYPDVIYFFHIRRKTLYYMQNVVLPCTLMSMLTLLVYCLPPDSGEKISLGITVLLAFSVFGLQVAEKVPETSESVPLIGIYLTIVMSMTGFSVVMTVMVLNFHHQGPFSQQVPPWAKTIILGHIRRYMGMKFPEEIFPQTGNYNDSGGHNHKWSEVSSDYEQEEDDEEERDRIGGNGKRKSSADSGGFSTYRKTTSNQQGLMAVDTYDKVMAIDDQTTTGFNHHDNNGNPKLVDHRQQQTQNNTAAVDNYYYHQSSTLAAEDYHLSNKRSDQLLQQQTQQRRTDEQQMLSPYSATSAAGVGMDNNNFPLTTSTGIIAAATSSGTNSIAKQNRRISFQPEAEMRVISDDGETSRKPSSTTSSNIGRNSSKWNIFKKTSSASIRRHPTSPGKLVRNMKRRTTLTEEFYRQSIFGANLLIQAAAIPGCEDEDGGGGGVDDQPATDFNQNRHETTPKFPLDDHFSESDSIRRSSLPKSQKRKRFTKNRQQRSCSMSGIGFPDNEVLRTLKMLIDRQQLDDECEEMCNEWRQVATVIDRLLFWIFLAGNLLATVILLVIIPLIYKDTSDFNITKYDLP